MIGFIGGGNMAEALVKGMTASGMKDILVSDPMPEKRKNLVLAYGIRTTDSNREVVSSCEIIILAVKPQNMDIVLDEIVHEVDDTKTVVSIAAGITLGYLQARLKTTRLIRVMPNTPAIVGAGMSVVSLCGCLSGREVDIVKTILMSVGKVLVMPEESMNAVTAISGSGPAFVALFVEALTDAGERLDLSRSDTRELVVQTLLGSAKLLDSGMAPDALRKMVTSPGGTTAAGLRVFEERNYKEIIYEAINAACRRAEELGRRD